MPTPPTHPTRPPTHLQDPTCAKLTLYGELRQVPPEAQQEARELLFSRHPAMADWPADHGFHLYELHLSHAGLLDWYGGLHVVGAQEYWAAGLEGAGQAGGRGGRARRLLRHVASKGAEHDVV